MLDDHAVVVAVSRDGVHRFDEIVSDEIVLLPGVLTWPCVPWPIAGLV